jgi:hypothetical protein
VLSHDLGLRWEPARITMPSGIRVEVDGGDPDRADLGCTLIA